MNYRVTLTACTAGNPLKAWRGGTDPDDVWEDQSRDFADLDAAKEFIRGLPEQTTTHVKLYADDELIFEQDADNDHLDTADAGVPMPHTVTSVNALDANDDIPEAPPLLQGA